jgi:phytanoyl-CoA hydroxylase
MGDPTLSPSQYNEHGFAHLRGFFDPAEVETVRREAVRVFSAQLARYGLLEQPARDDTEFESALFELFRSHPEEVKNCGKQVQHLVSLHRLSVDPRIERTLWELGLAFPNISTRPVLFFNSRHLAEKEVYWKVFPHQDWRSMQGSLDAVVVWVPLCDIDLSLGALEIVPGSHTLGLVTDEVVDGFGAVHAFGDADFVPVETKRGDALLMSAFLVHRSGNNTTESIRWSCHFRYNNLEEATFVERGYPHNYVYGPRDELITPGFPSRERLLEVFGERGPDAADQALLG